MDQMKKHDDHDHAPLEEGNSQTRRAALKKMLVGTGIATTAIVPQAWAQPAIKAIQIPAHGATSQPTTLPPVEPTTTEKPTTTTTTTTTTEDPAAPKFYELNSTPKMRVAANPDYDTIPKLITAEVTGTNVKVVIWADLLRPTKSAYTSGRLSANYKFAKNLEYTVPSQNHKELGLKKNGPDGQPCPTDVVLWRVRVNNLNDNVCALGIHNYENPTLTRVGSLTQNPQIVSCDDDR